jgi:hypothetical protein
MTSRRPLVSRLVVIHIYTVSTNPSKTHRLSNPMALIALAFQIRLHVRQKEYPRRAVQTCDGLQSE